jgi:hypothetical protein
MREGGRGTKAGVEGHRHFRRSPLRRGARNGRTGSMPVPHRMGMRCFHGRRWQGASGWAEVDVRYEPDT